MWTVEERVKNTTLDIYKVYKWNGQWQDSEFL